MREMYAQILHRVRQGTRCAVATLVEVRNARPAPIGTSLVVDPDGSFLGNIGAGCHETEIVEAARAALNHKGSSSLTFTLDDEVLSGSVCGASLRVVIWLPDEHMLPTLECIAKGDLPVSFTLGGFPIDIPKKRSLVIVGATELAAQIARFAHCLDFYVTVVDPRAEFASVLRHPDADRIVVAWPGDSLPALLERDTGIMILAHDMKIDLPALRAGLASDAAYIGILGSRRAQRGRFARLKEEGYSDVAIARIYGPAGLDIGAESSAQTALGILAEAIACINDRSGAPLRSIDGSIH